MFVILNLYQTTKVFVHATDAFYSYQMYEPQTSLATLFQCSCSVYMSISLHIHLLILKTIVSKISLFLQLAFLSGHKSVPVFEKDSLLAYTNILPNRDCCYIC